MEHPSVGSYFGYLEEGWQGVINGSSGCALGVVVGTAYGLGGLCGVYGLHGLSAFRELSEKIPI